MTFEIVPPAEGKVVLELDWKDAEILTRLVGLANSGNLSNVSPVLAEFVKDMVKHVGRSTGIEAKNYTARVDAGQVYIYPNPPF